MAIYKSSYNKKDEKPRHKEQNIKKERPVKEKTNRRINSPVVFLILFSIL